ncbi:hypothetical protein CL6EHI_138990 [Entamoeba histolytica]|nr:hypothetical protein CL6EHI_138990 [Entamoeba histolytica]
MSKKAPKMGTPFQPVNEVKSDAKAIKKYTQQFTGKDSSAAVKALLSMMSLGTTVVPTVTYSTNTEALTRCLQEIPDSIDNLFKKGGHSLSLQEVKTMLDVIKFSSQFLPTTEISKLLPVIKNFLCKDSNIEVRKETFKTLLELIKIHSDVIDSYGCLFLPSFNLRSYLSQEEDCKVPENLIPTINSNSNVYCPAELLDGRTQETNTNQLLELFFKEYFMSQDNIKLYQGLFYQVVCCVMPNYQKIGSLASLNIQHHFNIGDVPSKLYSKLGNEVLNAARGNFSRILLLDERFLSILIHFYTEMPNVFGPNDKIAVESFLKMYKDFFFDKQSNLVSILKDKLTNIQFKIIETPGQWFLQQFLEKELSNDKCKEFFEILIRFYESFGLIEDKLTPSLKSTILATVTQCALNFTQFVKNEVYSPYKKELLKVLFVLHIQWTQYEGDWIELLSRLKPLYDVDMLSVIQIEIEHLTTVFAQKVYNPTIFSVPLPIEGSNYIKNLNEEIYYDTPHSEPKLGMIKTLWDTHRIRELWLLLFKFIDHPLKLNNIEIISKNIEMLNELVSLLTFAEENATYEIKSETIISQPKPIRQSQWNIQPTNWKGIRKTIQPTSSVSPISNTTNVSNNDKIFKINESLYLPLQEIFLPIFIEIVAQPNPLITEKSKCLSFKSISRIICRQFPQYENEIYDIYTSLIQSIHFQTIDVQWAFISSSYDMFSNPNNKFLPCLPSVLQSLSKLSTGNSTLEDQIKCCSMINSLVFLEYNYPNLQESFNKMGLNLPGDYCTTMINIITGALRVMPQSQTQIMLYWSFVHLFTICLESHRDIDFRIFLDVFFEGVRSPSFIIYTTSLQILNYLSTKAQLLADNIINYIIDALCNIILTCPITIDCISFIFDTMSRWLLCYGKNMFSIRLLDETTHRLFQVIQMTLSLENPPENPDRPTTCIDPHEAAQKFVAVLSQVVFGSPTEHGMFKCTEANIPDQSLSRYFAYGDSTIISVLPSNDCHTRVFIRNIYGMYEFLVAPMQTINDIGLPEIKDDFIPISQIPWKKNNQASGIIKEKVFSQENKLKTLVEDTCKDDPSLLMCEFPEEIMKVDEYYKYITTIEKVMTETVNEEEKQIKEALDLVKMNSRQLDLSEGARDTLTEYLQNILSLYSMNDKLLVPIESTNDFLNEIIELDKLSARLFFKSTIIYVGENDMSVEKIIEEKEGSLRYKQFMRCLGWYQSLEGLICDPELCQKSRDGTICYYADAQYEYVFEEINQMDELNQKTISQVTSLICIIWDEGIKPYHPSIIGSYCEIVIVIKPNANGMYGIRIFRKKEMPIVGPLLNGMEVSGDVLGRMIREMIINIHFHYLGNGYSNMDGCSNRFQQLLKLVSFGHLPKDYTLCKELQLILDKKK